MSRPTLPERAMIHAENMQSEGWYTTANVLAECANALDSHKSNMTPKQYADAIERLGLSQRAAGRFLGVEERTSRRWISGESTIPESVAKLLRLMIASKISPDDVR